jgi:PAS domain S-box-containing protein
MDMSPNPNWRILHIDDDEDDHYIVRSLLSEAQSRAVTVEWAATLEEGRRLLDTHSYQAVLVDYDLGVETGIELIREYAGKGYAPPLILLTGRGNYEIDMEAMHAGATLYLTKNEINPLLLERSIRYAIERKQTEAELRLSEEKFSMVAERFKAVLENSLDVAYRRNLLTDRYEYMSPVVEQVLGFTSEEMMELTIGDTLERIHPDDRASVENALELAAVQGKGKLEYRFRCKDGQFRWLADHVTVTKDDQGKLLFRTGIIRDVTEQVRAEQALRASEERFQLASRAVTGVLYEWTIGRDQVYQSEGLERVVGYRPGEEPGGSQNWWPQNIHPEDYPVIQEELQRALAGSSESIAYEYRIRHRDGHWVHIWDHGYIVRDENGQPQRVVGLCSDISERVRAEQALRESESKHRQLAEALEVERATLEAAIENLPVGIGIADAQGNTLSLNSAGLALHDFASQAEMFSRLDKYIEEFELRYLDGTRMLVDDWPAAKALRGEFVKDFELQLVNKATHQTHSVSYSALPVYNSQGKLILIVYLIQDLSERLQTLVALEGSRAQLLAILNSLAEGVIIIETQGSVIDMNQSALEMLGYNDLDQARKLLSEYEDVFDVYSLEGRQLNIEEWPLSRLISGEDFTAHEVRICWRNSGEEWFGSFNGKWVKNQDGEPVVGVFTMRNITWQKKAEQALISREQRINRLFDANLIGIIMRDSSGRILEANDAYLEMMGFSREEVAAGNLNDRDITPPEYHYLDDHCSQESLAKGYSKPYEKEYICKDGTSIPVLIGYSLFAQEPAEFIGFVLDLRELKGAQNSLAEYAEKLKHSNEELENFAFVASHDLQEPLRKIHHFGKSLRQLTEGKLSAQAEEYLDRIDKAIERMQTMIAGLLNLSRINTSGKKFEPLNLTRIAREVVSDLEVVIQASGGQVLIESLPIIQGDAFQIRQLLQNLVANALKFQKAGVTPVVCLSGEMIRTEKKGQVRILVEDNGIGFKETDADRIFQPFVRLHGRNQYEGSGIGLTVCRKIVERHGGTITASSCPGEGSRFTIILPAAEGVG